MENSQTTPSVIAKLMGLDELAALHQPVSGHQKVLSEIYLQKSGSIGKRSRKDSQNYLLRSKKREYLRTNDSNKDILSTDFEQKNMGFDRTQGMKSPVVLNSENNGEKDKSNRLRTKIVVPRPNLGNVQDASRPFFLLNSQTTFAWEVKKQLLERHKLTKVSEELQSGFGRFIDIRSKKGRKHESVVKCSNFASNSSPKSGKLVNRMYAKTNSVSNSSAPFSVSSNFEPETKDVESFHGDIEYKCNYSSHLSDLSSEQDSSIRSREDGSMSSNCAQIDEERDINVEMYQRSPHSVLEPLFREDDSSNPECFKSVKVDLHGLRMQLQLLKSESEETDPEMVTSTDDEISSYTNQNISSMISFGPKETRDFSYLTDILDESGFQNGDVEIRFENWHSSECMASPSVFKTLEKKYGKQESWHTSERKLLFDRVNWAMTEIFMPRVDIRDCAMPLRRKMRNMVRRDVVEEELSALLLGQEMEVNDEVSEKAVGRRRWFDCVDELDFLVREIEMFLFETLAAELGGFLEAIK